MAERDIATRLRRAVKTNNLFLVKRLLERTTDMRNADPVGPRYTSLAWAASLGYEETFDYLLSSGHDDEELSKDADNNTILIILAGLRSGITGPYSPSRVPDDLQSAALRMARSYHDRFPFILDWSNFQGTTALHMAAIKGNEEFVAMLCDLHADIDLADLLGNTPLHYASSWGHLPIVKLLIERGCQFAARNNEGYTATDYAYSHHTKETLEDSARAVHDARKNARRPPYAQMRGLSLDEERPLAMMKDMRRTHPRIRSSSGTTTTSDSADELVAQAAYGHPSTSSVTSSLQSGNTPYSRTTPPRSHSQNALNGGIGPTPPSQPSTLHNGALGIALTTHSVLSPIASRVLANDADAMAEYMKRNRSGSQGESSRYPIVQASSLHTSSTLISATPPIVEEPATQKYSLKRLRPSLSAAALRQTASVVSSVQGIAGAASDIRPRFRAGTNPSPGLRPQFLPPVSSTGSADDSPESMPISRRAAPSGPLQSLYETTSDSPKTQSSFSPPALPPKDDPPAHRRGPSIS